MKIPKVDAKKILMQTAGEGVGLLLLGAAAKNAWVSKQNNLIKGLIYKVGAEVVMPLLAGKAGKGGEIVNGARNALSIAGTSCLVNHFKSGAVPQLGGYEQPVIFGPGYEQEAVLDGAGEGDFFPEAAVNGGEDWDM